MSTGSKSNKKSRKTWFKFDLNRVQVKLEKVTHFANNITKCVTFEENVIYMH